MSKSRHEVKKAEFLIEGCYSWHKTFKGLPWQKHPFFLVSTVWRGVLKNLTFYLFWAQPYGVIFGDLHPPPDSIYGIGDEPIRKEVTITNPFMNLTSGSSHHKGGRMWYCKSVFIVKYGKLELKLNNCSCHFLWSHVGVTKKILEFTLFARCEGGTDKIYQFLSFSVMFVKFDSGI